MTSSTTPLTHRTVRSRMCSASQSIGVRWWVGDRDPTSCQGPITSASRTNYGGVYAFKHGTDYYGILLKSGVPKETPAWGMNQVCGSGLRTGKRACPPQPLLLLCIGGSPRF